MAASMVMLGAGEGGAQRRPALIVLLSNATIPAGVSLGAPIPN
jgi:hypothetical protein